MNLNAMIRILVVSIVLSTFAWFVVQKVKPVDAISAIANSSHASSFSGGFPTVANASLVGGELQSLHSTCYDVGYSNNRGNPLWVMYLLHTAQDGDVAKRPSKFTMDDRSTAKIVHEYYNHSGYDRGHMAPNHAIGALCSDEAQMETFKMTNIIPQTPNLNQKWWERLERVEFTQFTKVFDQVWVIDGPIFSEHPVTLPNSNGKVQVPTQNYKIHIAQKAGKWHVIAFLVDQGVKGNEPLSQYLSTISEIEQKTGLSFLTQLPVDVQSSLKTSKNDPIWRLDQVDNLPSKY